MSSDRGQRARRPPRRPPADRSHPIPLAASAAFLDGGRRPPRRLRTLATAHRGESDGWPKSTGPPCRDAWSSSPGPRARARARSCSGCSRRPDLRRPAVSVSATTRPPRPGEVHGRDYVFVDPEEFERLRGDLLESAEVHGHCYGTPAEPVREALARGICVILVIDVQGGLQVREKVPKRPADLRAGARAWTCSNSGFGPRGPTTRRRSQRRLANARREIEIAPNATTSIVINDDLDRSVDELAGAPDSAPLRRSERS